MLNKKPQQGQTIKGRDNQAISGDGNQIVNGDINQHNTFIDKIKRKESSIEKILSGIDDIVNEEKIQFTPDDYSTYDIREKIDYNDLQVYREDYADFERHYSTIKRKINILTEIEPNIEQKIFIFIKDKYRSGKEQILEGAADDIINVMDDDIRSLLLETNGEISLDELCYVPYVIFYVFAECKIFKRPPGAQL